MARGLTSKQREFLREYLKDPNATQAAIRAGYSPKTADRQGSRLLRNVEVARAVEEHQRQADARNALTIERLERELARCTFVDPRKLCAPEGRRLELHELDEDTARAVSSVKLRIARVVRGPKAASSVAGLGLAPDPEGRQVEEVSLGTVEIKFHPKVEAIALGLKRRGALVEKYQHEFRSVSINIGTRRRENGDEK